MTGNERALLSGKFIFWKVMCAALTNKRRRRQRSSRDHFENAGQAPRRAHERKILKQRQFLEKCHGRT
jgi:hypothetical protein